MTPAKPPRKGARRAYHRSGEHTVRRAIPYLLERVSDARLPDDTLTPLERAARAWRLEAKEDLGSDLAATKRAVLDAATGSMILLASLTAELTEQLADWRGLLRAEPVLSRQLLRKIIVGRLAFAPDFEQGLPLHRTGELRQAPGGDRTKYVVPPGEFGGFCRAFSGIVKAA